MLVFGALVAAVIGLAFVSRPPRRRTGAILLAAGIVALLIAGPRDLALDKLLARFVLPAGLFWALLIAAAVTTYAQRRTIAASGFTMLAVLYWAVGAPVWGDLLLARLEAPYVQASPLSGEPLDAVAVLGGGTQVRGGRPGLDLAGDRVLLGAQLFLQGRTRRLIATGSSIAGLGPPRDLAGETTAIWRSLGIPEGAIRQVPEPKNTRQEIEALSKLVRTSTVIQTLGLVTSAWHLPRALASCERLGLEVVPLPADVRTQREAGPPNVLAFIPDGSGFYAVHRAGWEILGRAVGR